MLTNTPAPSVGGLPASLSRDGIRRGTDAKWTAQAGWTDRDGLPLPSTMLVIGFTTALKKWKNKKVEFITTHPLPDPELRNAAIPVAEWEVGRNGKPQPPWKKVYVVWMVDLTGGQVFTYKNSTYGALLMFEQLEERVAVMQMLRGEQVMPIVRLDKRPWHSATFGPQMRPHLEPIEWRKLGSNNPQPALPVATTPPQLPPPATSVPVSVTAAPVVAAAPAAPAPAPAAPASTVLDHTKPVQPVTVGELIADEIPLK